MISNRNAHKGFTLIELLVVIAIIAILAAILFPVFAKAREKARTISCASNMKQLGLGIAMYYQDYDEKLPYGTDNVAATDQDEDGWVAQITPYLKSTNILKCPDDSTQSFTSTIVNTSVLGNLSTNYQGLPAGTVYVPISYGLNSNIFGTTDASFVEVDRTIIGFEVEGAYGAPTTTPNDTAGPSGNGIPVAPVVGPVAIANAGTLSCGFDCDASLTGGTAGTLYGTLQYETGYMNGTQTNDYTAPTGGYDATYSGGGIHTGGSNFLYADTHVKWAQPNAIYVGANNTNTTLENGVGANQCGINPGGATAYAANTAGCTAPSFGGTFSID